MHQAMAVGVEAIPIVSLISFFVGMILALQGAYELRQLGAMQLVRQRRGHFASPANWVP